MGLKTIAGITAAAGVFGFLGAMDYSDALIQDAIEKQARPLRVAAEDRPIRFYFPIDYKAIVCQRGAGERGTCRFYTERSK